MGSIGSCAIVIDRSETTSRSDSELGKRRGSRDPVAASTVGRAADGRTLDMTRRPPNRRAGGRRDPPFSLISVVEAGT
jgi:hypothetical protein